MTIRRNRRLAANVPLDVRWVWTLLVVVVVAAACSAPDEPRPTGPDELVLRVVDTGGLLGPGHQFQLPALSLYGDGLLVLAGKPVRQRRLTVEGVRRVVEAAVNAGLTKEHDYGTPQILDAPVSIYTIVTSKRVETKIIGPSEGDSDSARRRVHTFRKALNDLDSWLGDEIGPAAPAEFGAHVAYSYKTSGQDPTLPWPYGDLPDAGCLPLSAAQARALRQASPGRLWQHGDNQYLLVLRPLLPDEKGCADFQ